MKIYPIEYENFVQKYSEEYDVDKYLVFAIIKAESNFKDGAVSSKGAKGLMQLMDSTAEDIASSLNMDLNVDDDILDPEININLGTKYVSMMMKKYNCIELALAAYNAGSGNVDSWIKDSTLKDDGSDIENIPYKETNNYVRKILRDYEIYKKLYE
jgi:soluble lytic murein transglycosylase